MFSLIVTTTHSTTLTLNTIANVPSSTIVTVTGGDYNSVVT
jgi:hypothetical protein